MLSTRYTTRLRAFDNDCLRACSKASLRTLFGMSTFFNNVCLRTLQGLSKHLR